MGPRESGCRLGERAKRVKQARRPGGAINRPHDSIMAEVRKACAAGPLGQALLESSADRRWWLAGTIKRDEWNGGNAAEMHVEDAALA